MTGLAKRTTRLEIALRVLAAIPANYAVTVACTMLLARLLPGPRESATLGATMMSFTIFATIALAAFGVRSLARLWIGLVVAGGAAAGVTWLMIETGGRL